MTIAIAADHAGYKMKEQVKDYLQNKGYQVFDVGSYSPEASDYPDFAHPLAIAVENKTCDLGISMCGSGNGINMAANKHAGIRSALCWDVKVAELARKHNDANVCALPARFLNIEKAEKIIDAFLTTEFEGGRHNRRIDKIPL